MESTSVTRKYDTASDLACVIEKLDALQARAEKKDLNGSLAYTWVEVPETDDNAAEWVLTLDFTGDFALGDYAPVAVIDFTAIETGLVLTIDDTVEIGEDLDPTRCDHCGRHRNRNKVVVVTDGTDLIHVGGTCAQDFLGRNPEWLTWIADAIETPEAGTVPTVYPTKMVIAAAIEACRIGYRKANDESPTKSLVFAMLNGSFTKKSYEHEHKQLAAAPPARHTVDEVIDWMLNESGDGDFGANMRRLAESPTIGARGLGIASYAPAGADAWRDKMAAAAAKRAAEEARKAEAAPVPVTDKRIRIEGIITTVRNVDTDWGTTTKIRVETDEGWACWGTLPKDCEAGSPWNEDGSWKDDDEIEAEAGRGDRIAFMARIEVSADDDKFGFFTRPTKGEIVARGEVEVAA
jgi:hypothetical protein